MTLYVPKVMRKCVIAVYGITLSTTKKYVQCSTDELYMPSSDTVL